MWRQLRIWDILLLGLNALLLSGIIWGWSGQDWLMEQPPRPSVLPVPQVSPWRDLQSLEAFQNIIAKNLLSPQRRASPTLCMEIAGGQDSLQGGRLLGIIIIDQGKAAIVSQGNPGARTQIEVLRPGEFWQGYEVIDICKDSVTFRGKGGTKTLLFPSPDKATQVARPPEGPPEETPRGGQPPMPVEQPPAEQPI